MRILLTEFVSTLREEGELDFLLRNILINNKFTPTVYPKKGVRQKGVDIEVVGNEDGVKKLLIVSVKRGDVNRKIWDGDINAIRQSLDQIVETHIPYLPKHLSKLPCKIILATNGEMIQDVKGDWDGYVAKNSSQKLEFEFWGLPNIVDKIDLDVLSKAMLTQHQISLFRKTLALIEDSSYDLRHIYKLIDELLNEQIKIDKIVRLIRALNLIQSIIHQWCKTSNNLKNSYIVSERILLKLFYYISFYKLSTNKKVQIELGNIVNKRIEIGWEYFEKIEPQLSVPYGLAKYANTIEFENANISIELLGKLSQIGSEHFLMWVSIGNNDPIKSILFERVEKIISGIEQLVINNPTSCRPNFDDQLIEYTILFNFLFETQNFSFGVDILRKVVEGIIDNYRFNKNFIPLFHDNRDQLLNLYLGNEDIKVESSHLLIILCDFALIFGSFDLYKIIFKLMTTNEDFKNLNLQIWVPEKDSNIEYFNGNIIKSSGLVFASIKFEEDYRKYRNEIINQLNFSISINKECTTITPLMTSLASRHYRNIPFPFFWRRHLVNLDELSLS